MISKIANRHILIRNTFSCLRNLFFLGVCNNDHILLPYPVDGAYQTVIWFKSNLFICSLTHRLRSQTNLYQAQRYGGVQVFSRTRTKFDVWWFDEWSTKKTLPMSVHTRTHTITQRNVETRKRALLNSMLDKCKCRLRTWKFIFKIVMRITHRLYILQLNSVKFN